MNLKKSNKCAMVFALMLGLTSVHAISATKAANNSVNQTLFSVSHVKKDDNLNVRIGAGVDQEIVTTIPFDGNGIELLGDEAFIGKTQWVLIKWKGITGWVSRYYLRVDENEVVKITDNANDVIENAEKTLKDVEEPIAKNLTVAGTKNETDPTGTTIDSADVTGESAELDNIGNQVQENEWVLQCGNKTPYWKVQVHPKWMNVAKGDYETGLPIIAKKQEKNRWNTALKTVVHGKNGRNNLKMTIKYAYSKRCYDTLSGLRVPYKVTTEFNGEELTGCCRAVELEKPIMSMMSSIKEAKLSLK